MKTLPVRVLLAWWWVLAGLVCLSAADNGKASSRSLGEALRQRNSLLNGTVIVQGEVVDDQGQALDKVTVDVDRFVASGWEGRSYQTKQTVDGSFSLTFREAARVLLRFHREGHHWEQLSFTFAEPSLAERAAGKTRTFSDVRVVLAKLGVLARLDEYNVRVTWAEAVPITVWDISAVGATRSSPRTRAVQPPEVTSQQSILYARVVPTPIPTPALTDTSGAILCPADSLVRIVLGDGADGGFVPVGVPNTDTGPDRPLRELKQAPEVGYSGSLDLTGDAIRDMVERRVHICFYVKMNGLYGKGEARRVVFLKDGSLEVRAVFRLQPDGSRNVETTE